MGRVLMTTILGAVAGFCTRPCCAIPAAMSLFGLSGVAFAQTAVAYRPAFMSVSGLMLGGDALDNAPTRRWLLQQGSCGHGSVGGLRALASGIGGLVTFRRAICAFAIAGSSWLLPSPASAQMT